MLYDVNLIHSVYTIAKYHEYFHEQWLYLLLELVSAEFRWTYFVNSTLALEHVRSYLVSHFQYHNEICDFHCCPLGCKVAAGNNM